MIDLMNEELVKEVTHKEVKKVVFRLRALKALELDGFSYSFFQKHWNTID